MTRLQYWLSGGWFNGGCYHCRSAFRVNLTPDTRTFKVGFRVVRGGGK